VLLRRVDLAICTGGLARASELRRETRCREGFAAAAFKGNPLQGLREGNNISNIDFAWGVRTPFSKVDDVLTAYDAIELSVQAMAAPQAWHAAAPHTCWDT
jgi:hypothetical protein